MTNTFINPIIAACLFHADIKLGDGEWAGTTTDQAEFVELLPTLRDVFLSERGYDISLTQEPSSSRALYLAAVLDLLVRWRQPGERSSVWIPAMNRRVPSVKLIAGKYSICGDVMSPNTEDVRVLMTVAENLDDGLAKIEHALERSEWTVGSYKYAEFPTVELDRKVDVSMAVGLTKGDARVSQAVAQAKLRLDELGAHAQAAAAMAVTRGMSSGFSIDGPFTIAFATDAGIAIAFHVGLEDFKAPRKVDPKRITTATHHKNTW